MKTITPDFAEDQTMSAARWNEIATTVNALWQSRATGPLRLVKGDNWALSVDPKWLRTLPNAPANADELTIVGLPGCDDGTPTTIYVPAIPA